MIACTCAGRRVVGLSYRGDGRHGNAGWDLVSHNHQTSPTAGATPHPLLLEGVVQELSPWQLELLDVVGPTRCKCVLGWVGSQTTHGL